MTIKIGEGGRGIVVTTKKLPGPRYQASAVKPYGLALARPSSGPRPPRRPGNPEPHLQEPPKTAEMSSGSRSSPVRQTSAGPEVLVQADINEVTRKLETIVKSIIEKFPPSQPKSAIFRQVSEKYLGTAPKIGTKAEVKINPNISRKIGAFSTSLSSKITPYINHRVDLISKHKKQEAEKRRAEISRLKSKINQPDRQRSSAPMTFEEYIDSQIKKQDQGMLQFDQLNRKQKQAKISELEKLNLELKQDLQILLAEEDLSIPEPSGDDNFNLKAGFFAELTDYTKPVLTNTTFTSENPKKHTDRIADAIGTKITVQKQGSTAADGYEVTLDTDCELGKYLDATEKTIQDRLKTHINLQIARNTTGLALVKTQIENSQRIIAFGAFLGHSSRIQTTLSEIKDSVTKKLQAQLKKISELERSIESESEKVDGKQQGTTVLHELQPQAVVPLVLSGGDQEKAIEKVYEEEVHEGVFHGEVVQGEEFLEGGTQKAIPEIIDEQIRLEKLVTKLQIEIKELSQQLSEKDAELQALQSSDVSKLTSELIILKRKLEESESKVRENTRINQEHISRQYSLESSNQQLESELRVYKGSELGTLVAEMSQKEVEIARMKGLVEEIKAQDEQLKSNLLSLQQSLAEANQRNLLLQEQLLETQSTQEQSTLPLRQEDSVLSMVDTRRENELDDSDLDDELDIDIDRIRILEAQRDEKLKEFKSKITRLTEENQKLLESLTSLESKLKELESSSVAINQQNQDLKQKLAVTNAENQKLKTDLREVRASLEARDTAEQVKPLDLENELQKARSEATEAKDAAVAAEARAAAAEAKAAEAIAAAAAAEERAAAAAATAAAEAIAAAEARAAAVEAELARLEEENKLTAQQEQERAAAAAAAEQKTKEAEARAAAAAAEARATAAEARAREAEARATAAEAELARLEEENKLTAQQEQERAAAATAKAIAAAAAAAEAELARLRESTAVAKAEAAEARATAAVAEERAANAEARAATAEAELQRVREEVGATVDKVRAVATEERATAATATSAAEVRAAAAAAEERAAAAEAKAAEAIAAAEVRAAAVAAEARAAAAAAEAIANAEARAAAAKAELQRIKSELEQTRSKLTTNSGSLQPPSLPITSFSRRRPSVKLTRTILGGELTVDGRRARLFSRSGQSGRKLPSNRRRKLKFLEHDAYEPRTLLSTASVLSAASGADAIKSSTGLPVYSIPARPEMTASLLPLMPPYSNKTPTVSDREPLRSSLDLKPVTPNKTIIPTSITVFFSVHRRLKQQEDLIKNFLSMIAQGVVTDDYMKNEEIYTADSKKYILSFFQEKNIKFKDYDQALSIIRGVFVQNKVMKEQFKMQAVGVDSHIFKDAFLKKVKESLSSKKAMTISRG